MNARISACCVCGRPLDEIYAVTCSLCGGQVHFDPAETATDTCAIVLTRPNACALAFVCLACYEKRRHESTQGTP